MKQAMLDVLEFHRQFGVFVSSTPHDFKHITPNIRQLRMDMLTEEMVEYLEAEGAHDVVQIADALADMVYIICGTALAYGIPLDAVWTTVHLSNLRKIGGAVRGDGKILKPEGWTPPDVKGVMGL
jgi:predicted HAD superfamily Cof-like phosphohydrolase